MSKLNFAIVFLFLGISFSFGAGGIDKVNTFLENAEIALYSIGVVILTIAIMFGAAKMMYQHATFAQVLPIFIAGIIFGSASAIAGYFLG